MMRTSFVALALILTGCNSTGDVPQAEGECSKEHLLALEREKGETMKTLDAKFSEWDRSPTPNNLEEKDRAAMAAAE